MRIDKRRQLGFTLVEMLVAITLSSSVMLVAVALVHRALDHHVQARGRVQAAVAFNRFAEQFRLDVHQARAMESSDEGLELLGQDGATISYVAAGHVLTRKQPQAAQLHVSQVELNRDCTVGFVVDRERAIATLLVEIRAEALAARVERRVAAALGLFSRSTWSKEDEE